MCVVVIAMFSACNKEPEGVYNPSKKIQKIYNVENNVKELAEVWHWNGDLLTSFDQYYGMDFYTTTFSYDDMNRLIAMDNVSSHSECTYDGKKIQKIVITSDDVVLGTYEFEHKGNKISKIKMNVDLGWEDLDWDKMGMINPLRFLVPEICSTVESAMKKCSKDAKGEDITLILKWSGNNVKTIDVSYTGYFGMVSETVEITYDNKINPTYGLLAQLSTDAVANLFVNKNNPLSIVTRVMGSVYNNATYTYEYEDNYPVKVTCVDVEDPGTTYENTETSTTIYEY